MICSFSEPSNSASILERCLDAWQEGRPVRLDYPDHISLRRQSDVVAMRLAEVEEGPLLILWIRKPLSELQEKRRKPTNETRSHPKGRMS